MCGRSRGFHDTKFWQVLWKGKAESLHSELCLYWKQENLHWEIHSHGKRLKNSQGFVRHHKTNPFIQWNLGFIHSGIPRIMQRLGFVVLRVFLITTLTFHPLSWELVQIENYITDNVISPIPVWEKLGRIVVASKSTMCWNNVWTGKNHESMD